MDQTLLSQSLRAAARADFSRSGGPGGQNVNKVNTKVTLRAAVADIAGLNAAEAARLRETLAGRITKEGEIVIQADGERSQWSNLEAARARLEALVRGAARLPKTRRPTRPGKAAREKRLASKRRRSELKNDRLFRPEE